MLTPWHVKATVVRSYKGDWKVGEQLAFVHYVDAPAPTNSPTEPSGNLMFVFAREHTSAEMKLDTGEFAAYQPKLEPALDWMFPNRP
jgi:hypothetical protein